MSSRSLIAGLPLATGSVLISVAVLGLPFPEGAFILEWVGSFLVLYGLSYLTGSRVALSLSGVILVAGSLGDMTLLEGLNPTEWVITNYMVFIHAALGSFAGMAVRGLPVGNG